MFNWRELPLNTAAALAAGLPGDSRVNRRFSGLRPYPQELMLAEIIDLLRWLKWAQTEDGHKGRNHPKSVVEYLMEPAMASERQNKKGFASVAEFEAAYRKLTGQA